MATIKIEDWETCALPAERISKLENAGYEFVGEQKPEAFMSIGAPAIFTRAELPTAKAIAATLETTLTCELDQLRADVGHLKDR